MAANVAVLEVEAVAVKIPSLETRVEWFDEWEENTRDAQRESLRDRDYYDGHQWTKEEIEALMARGQPVLTKNRIARKINFILGEEIKKRIDPAARPRTPQHEDGARAMTDALRYVADEQSFNKVRSAVLKNVLVEGYGGALKGVEDDGSGGYAHTLLHVEWDRLFYDPHSRSPDFSDAKYLGIVAWMDLDDAVLEYPDAAEELEQAVESASTHASDTTDDVPRKSWADRKRKRVKICEMYFRLGADWYVSFFTRGVDLREPEQTFLTDEMGRKHVCPLVMMSCYVDREGNRYGVVRQLISPQDEVNKRSSKGLHLLNSKGVIAERDAIRDPDRFMAELAKPDPFAEVEPGTLAGPDGPRVQVIDGVQLAAAQMQMLQESKQDIDTIGPSSSTLPDLPSSSSGRAFIARQQAAAQELGTLFDQLRDWSMRVFEADWLCVRQYWSEEKWLRVTDDQELNGYRFVALNRQMTRAQRLQELIEGNKQIKPQQAVAIAAGDVAPIVIRDTEQAHGQMAQQAQAILQQYQQSGQQPPPQLMQQVQQLDSPEHLLQMIAMHPLMQDQVTVNQVDQMLVDIVIDESPDTAILAQEEFATLSELAPTVVNGRPDMAPTIVKLMIKASQLPNKRELLQELEKGPDPQQQQQQQQAQQLQIAQAQAGLAVSQSVAQLNQAKAQGEQLKLQLDGARVQLDGEKVKQQGAKVPSEIQRNEAAALRDSASAQAAVNPVPQGWQ